MSTKGRRPRALHLPEVLVAVTMVMATPLLAQEVDPGLATAKEHLALLTSHQAFLENMYFTAMILIGVVVALFMGLVVFFGLRTKSQIDETVKNHFSGAVRARVDKQFDELEEMISTYDAVLRQASAQVADDLAGSNEAIAGIEEKLEQLQHAIIELQERLDVAQEERIKDDRQDQTTDPDELAWQRMRYALIHHKFVWRSIERLALAARLAPEQAEAILKRHGDEVRLSTGKSGRRIARHLTREPRN